MAKKESNHHVENRGREQRRHERFGLRRNVLVLRLDENLEVVGHWWCILKDLSQGGACFFGPELPGVGETVIIAVSGEDGAPQVLVGRVTSAAYDATQWARVGVQFTPPTDTIASLISQAARQFSLGPTPERRSA